MKNVKKNFIVAMRKMVHSVTVISSTFNKERCAITVSSLTSLSVNPPSLLVCINKESSFAKCIQNEKLLNVNFLNPNQQDLAEICSSRDKANDRFVSSEWFQDKNGIPYIPSAESVAFCKITKKIDYATHLIVILDVYKVALNSEGEPNPLLYSNGSYHSL